MQKNNNETSFVNWTPAISSKEVFQQAVTFQLWLLLSSG